jgi:septum formation protein
MTQPYNQRPQLILASTSIYRSDLMKKTGLSFLSKSPLINEDILKSKLLSANKSAIQIAEALSQAKAQSVLEENSVIISGDQLVLHKNRILGKPGTKLKAIQQLNDLQDDFHELITAVTIRSPDKIFHLNHVTKLFMRKLSATEIENYVDLDMPTDCAGSYKIEEHGLCLFSKIECDDFSAIQGLPMIWISTQLKGFGYELFK